MTDHAALEAENAQLRARVTNLLNANTDEVQRRRELAFENRRLRASSAKLLESIDLLADHAWRQAIREILRAFQMSHAGRPLSRDELEALLLVMVTEPAPPLKPTPAGTDGYGGTA